MTLAGFMGLNVCIRLAVVCSLCLVLLTFHRMQLATVLQPNGRGHLCALDPVSGVRGYYTTTVDVTKGTRTTCVLCMLQLEFKASFDFTSGHSRNAATDPVLLFPDVGLNASCKDMPRFARIGYVCHHYSDRLSPQVGHARFQPLITYGDLRV